MKIFNCEICSQTLFFENVICESCSTGLGYIPEQHMLSAIEPSTCGHWSTTAKAKKKKALYKYCSNFEHGVCNWLLPKDSDSEHCIACELNRYIPNMKSEKHKEEWRQLEFAKHRLVYSLLRLKLPLSAKSEENETGLSFDFITENDEVPEDAATMTGHAAGQVTIKVEEADPVEREQMRVDMNEPYRALIGHFRHEVGHYYWDHLIAPFPKKQKAFIKLFGDESLDYQQALKDHYAKGENEEWKQSHVSSYAASHPWEDWAETWAHYFHIIDALETAYTFGLSITPPKDPSGKMSMTADVDPYKHNDFEDSLERCLVLSFAVNSLNRSMGQPDLYPFILTAPVKEKLLFIHKTIKKAAVKK